MTILSDNSFDLSAFSPELAELLGSGPGEEGCHLITVAAENGRSDVAPRDWLYCLVRNSGTIAHRYFIQSTRKQADSFISSVESAYDDEFMADLPAASLTTAHATAEVLPMLDRAQEIATTARLPHIDEAALTLAILETADDELREMLTLWSTEAGLNKMLSSLRRGLVPRDAESATLFDDRGEIQRSRFSVSGRRLLQRITDDVAGLGMKALTTRNVLYTLLETDSGPLSLGLTVAGFDVRKEFHSLLARELKRAGQPKRSEFVLTKDTCLGPVLTLFEAAQQAARERGSEQIAEVDVHRAFAEKEYRELTRLVPVGRSLDDRAFIEYVRSLTSDEIEDDAQDEESAPQSAREIEAGILSRLYGQNPAVSRVLPWIKRLRFGLPREGRPACVLLFVGPTGTGKTQLAKELARYVFGNEEHLLFLEMGQFKTEYSMTGLIGASPGYVGYGDGKLTNGLRDQPECVVLFDEIEKAHTQVFDVILRFADEGLISDPAGPVRDGRKCIIIMTTNAGQTWLRRELKQRPDLIHDPETLSREMFDAAMTELSDKGFRPEFLARVDERITFLPHSYQTCEKMIDSILEGEAAKLLKLKRITLDVRPEVRKHLAQECQSRVLEEGARVVPRIVNEEIISPMIDFLVDSDATDFDNQPVTVEVAMVGGSLTMEVSH